MKIMLTVITLLLLTACQSIPVEQSSAVSTEPTQPQSPSINPRLLTMGESLSVDPIFKLTEQQAADFLQAFHDDLAYLPPHLRLAEYLGRLTSNYNYRERTLTASEAFSGKPGNCMSLVVLTTALANLVNLEIDYQRLTTNPIFDKQQGVILISDHVRSRVFAPKDDDRRVLQAAHAIIDYFPAQETRRAESLDTDGILAMYYSNLAAESILDDDLAAATQSAQMALKYDPKHVNAFNLLAILHNRIEDDVQAEAFFRHGLEHHPENLNLLNNYHDLLMAQDRQEEADQIQERVAALHEVNPYQLIALAKRAFQNNEPRQALSYYQQVLKIAPYLHEVYVQQAVVLESMGQGRRATETLHEGLAQARLAATEDSYKRRVSAIKIDSQNAW